MKKSTLRTLGRICLVVIGVFYALYAVNDLLGVIDGLLDLSLEAMLNALQNAIVCAVVAIVYLWLGIVGKAKKADYLLTWIIAIIALAIMFGISLGAFAILNIFVIIFYIILWNGAKK